MIDLLKYIENKIEIEKNKSAKNNIIVIKEKDNEII